MLRSLVVQFILLVLAVENGWTASMHNSRATGPLPDYVYRDDPNYEWSVYSRTPQGGYTTVYLSLTSQQWYDETLSDTPIWHHYLVVHVPDNIQYTDAAFLYISKGRNPGPPSITDDHIERTGQYANITGMVTAALKYVPNQPIIFEDDGIDRTEDEIIAWTWKRFYNESSVGIDNPEVLLRMPMCKASVRGMDAIQEFIQQENGNQIAKFMIAGESKRGWTTWLTGAIDNRVVAMAPVVLSCVNMIPVFHHYYRSLGGWSFALFDYWIQRLMGLIDTPEMAAMSQIIDPYAYRQWMTMPKLMVSASSDEFFMADDYDYFYDDLLGEKYIWLVENSGHEIDESDSIDDYWDMLQTFYIGVLQDYQIPSMSWTRFVDAGGGSITLQLSVLVTPVRVVAFSAPSVSPDRRDFRTHMREGISLVPTNIVWTEKQVTYEGNGMYSVNYVNPAEGYLCFFIRVDLPGPDNRVYHFTTQAHIIPPTFPYEDCVGSECQGILV